MMANPIFFNWNQDNEKNILEKIYASQLERKRGISSMLED